MRKAQNLYRLFKVLGLLVVALISRTVVRLIKDESEPSNTAPSETSTTVSNENVTVQSGTSITVTLKPSITASSKCPMAVTSKSPNNNSRIQELEKTWKIKNKEGIAVRSASNNSSFYLLKEPQHFPIILSNTSVCRTSSPETHVYLIVIVHSSRDNPERRQVIRDTWGSITSVNNLQMRIVFLLGSDQEASEAQQKTDESILTENQDHGDVVMGGFHDSYRNLTYKHLMGYRWVLEHCSNASFVLKTDDDVFVDIKELVEIVKDMHINNAFLGIEMSENNPVRSQYKHAVEMNEYPNNFYPTYCSGLAYTVSLDAVQQIVNASQGTRFFWVDDVYVTGMLRELAEDAPGVLPLNDKYSFNTNVTEAWESYHKTLVKPFVVYLLEGDDTFAESMKFLWTAVNSA